MALSNTQTDHPDRVLAVAVGICLLAYLISVPVPRVDNQLIDSDGTFYYDYLPAPMLHGDLDFTQEYTYFFSYDPEISRAIINDRTPRGLPANQWSIGPAILWVPFFLLAHLLANLIDVFGGTIPTDGLNNFYQLFVLLGNILYGGAGLFLTYRLVREFVAEETALAATVLVVFAGNLVYYMTVAPYMSHSVSAFASGLFFYTWVRRRKQPGVETAALYGFLGALMALVRPQDGVFIALPFLARLPDVCRSLRWHGVTHEWQRWLRDALVAGLVALATYSPQMLIWGQLYGDYFRSPYLYWEDPFNLLSPRLGEALFSSSQGLFVWYPIFLLALLGLLLAYRRDPMFAGAAFLGFAMQWYIISSWFGLDARMFFVCTPIFTMGLAFLIEWLYRRGAKPIVYAMGGLLLVWNFLLLVEYRFYLIYADHLPTWFELTIGRVTIPVDLLSHLLK